MVLQQGCLIWYGDLLGIHVKRSASKWPFLTRLIFKSRWNVIQVDLARLWSFPGAGNTNLASFPQKNEEHHFIYRMDAFSNFYTSYCIIPSTSNFRTNKSTNINKFIIPPGSLTARPWKMMVGRLSPFLLGPGYLFRGELFNFGGVYKFIQKDHLVDIKSHHSQPVRLRRPLFCFAPSCLDAYHRLPEVRVRKAHGRNFVTDGWWSIWALMAHSVKVADVFLLFFLFCFFSGEVFLPKFPKNQPQHDYIWL